MGSKEIIRERLSEAHANILIDYMEELSTRTNHQQVMAAMQEQGWTEKELDKAARALGEIAGRDFGML